MSLLQFSLSVHLLSIGLGLGMGFSNIVGFRVAKGLGGDKAMGIASHRESLIPYGDAFFTLIILSGVTNLWAIGGTSGLNFWFQAKMVTVVVWIVFELNALGKIGGTAPGGTNIVFDTHKNAIIAGACYAVWVLLVFTLVLAR